MIFPVYFWLGSLRIHPHFLFESLAYAVVLRLVLRNVRKDSIAPEQRTSVIIGGMLGALLGAKFLVWLQHIDLIWQNPQQLLFILVQGKTIVGALLGGVIGVEITEKILGVNRSTGDVFVFPLIIGTALGRIGCFLTGLSDQTYGIPRHPTQLYEIIFLLILMLFLHLRSRYQRQEGDLFKFYLISYLSFRFLIDFIKPDFRPFLGVSAIQIACFITIFCYRRNIIQIFQIR